MNGYLEKQDYALESLFSAFAVYSSTYLDFSEPLTYLTLLFVPMLFGYTAYISRDGFRNSSLISTLMLIFVTQGELLAIMSVIIGVGNVLVSYFSSGTSFKSYYGSVALPLMGSGLVLGLMFFGAVTASPQYADKLENKTADYVAEESQKIVDKTGLTESQRDAQGNMVERVSKSSIRLTEAHIYNETQGELDQESWKAVNDAFSSARDEVPNKMRNQLSKSEESSSTVSTQSKAVVGTLFEDGKLFMSIPLIMFGIFGLNPIVGIITAIFGVTFTKIDFWLVSD